MFLAGVVVTLFVGFLANRLGFLSVHKRPEREVSEGSGGSGGGVDRDLRHK